MSTASSRIACPEVAHNDAGAVGRGVASEQGRVRLKPEVQVLLWCLVACWNHMVRSQLDAAVPASTSYIEGYFGRFKPRARRALGFGTSAGTPNFVRLMARGTA